MTSVSQPLFFANKTAVPSWWLPLQQALLSDTGVLPELVAIILSYLNPCHRPSPQVMMMTKLASRHSGDVLAWLQWNSGDWYMIWSIQPMCFHPRALVLCARQTPSGPLGLCSARKKTSGDERQRKRTEVCPHLAVVSLAIGVGIDRRQVDRAAGVLCSEHTELFFPGLLSFEPFVWEAKSSS